jgi:hypothetical protein
MSYITKTNLKYTIYIGKIRKELSNRIIETTAKKIFKNISLKNENEEWIICGSDELNIHIHITKPCLYLTIETINGINNKDLKKYKQKLDEIVDIKCKELEEELRRLSNLKNDVNLILYGRW